MNVSLDQAIEIHAKALKHRFGKRAPLLAEEKADHCAARGDDEAELSGYGSRGSPECFHES
jgi:hypothetical protein